MSTVFFGAAGAGARAQSAEPSVGVLRATAASTPTELAEAIDAALLRDLREIAGIANPVVSPIDLAEIQLSVGCADDGRACLESMARAAGVSALLVRSLSVAEGGAQLELRYFDSASSDEPKVVHATLPAGESAELTSAVPKLVRELFGVPEVAAPAEPVAAAASETARTQTVERAPSAGDETSIAPFILLGAGAAALAVGIIVGTIASDDFNAWKHRPIRSTAEADDANADFEDLETRALAADIAMIGSAAVLALGATLLTIELAEGSDASERGPTLGFAPRPSGGQLLLRGAFDEAL